MVEMCGVKAIAVHGRFQEERSRNPNHNDFIREIAKILIQREFYDFGVFLFEGKKIEK